MRSNNRFRASRGLSLIESLVGSALFLVVFLGIFGVYQLAIDLVFSTKAAGGASALVNERIEYIRGLTYDGVGTVGGIPSGSIPQVEIRTLNGVPYTLETFIQYVDDPADGIGAADQNGVAADYKNVRVSAHWAIRNIPRSTFALTSIAPKGIETMLSGGTLRINVFNISASPVSGADVRIVNTTVSPAVDVTVTTGSTGSVWLPGARPGSGYQVTVTKAGYSSAQTYTATTQNPNPNPGHVAVVDDTTTTLSLEINQTGSLDISTWRPQGSDSFSDAFANQSLLSATTSTTVAGGSLRLSGSAGSYPSEGSALSIPIAPQYLSSWTSFGWSASTSPQASASFRFYYWNGTEYVPVPDEALPGNIAGFTTSPVSLSGLPTATYATLQVRPTLSSADTSWTPEILDWEVSYVAGPTPLPNVPFSIHGIKNIGISQSGAPIYKMTGDYTTTTYGTWVITPVEADGYVLSLPQGSPYVIREQCPIAVSVLPGQSATASLTLSSATAHSLRAIITGGGNPLGGASVLLQGNGVNQTLQTSSCGQVLFTSIPAGSYTVTVSASGYQAHVDPNVAVSGAVVYSAALTQ